jgi:hypothetical protein
VGGKLWYSHPAGVEALTAPQSGHGRKSRLSFEYIAIAKHNCLLLFKQVVRSALALALAKAGKSSAARIAIIAITTSSSINVKPCLHKLLFRTFLCFIVLALILLVKIAIYYFSNLKLIKMPHIFWSFITQH